MNSAPFFSKTLCRFAFAVLSITVFFSAAQAAVYTVTKIADTDDGVCNADCSLREAVAQANASASNDTIEFDPALFSTPQTIALGSSLVINNNGSFALHGTSADNVLISGNEQVRVFFINTGVAASFYRVTIKRGRGIGSGFNGGGGIYNRGNLTLTESIVTENLTFSTDPNAIQHGGGIYNAGIMQIHRSRVEFNQASRTPEVVQVGGGGIYNGFQANLQIFESSIAFNLTEGNGGGINNNAQATLTLINSTVSNNSATGSQSGSGGGITNFATVNVAHSTITENFATIRSGGVSTSLTSGMFNSRNSIYGHNYPLGTGQDFSGPMISGGYNLIERNADAVITGDTTGNLLGQDPLLHSINFNGGFARSHLLRPNSPALDKGKSLDITNDQRRFARPYDNPTIPNAPGGDGSDIGAVEMRISEFTAAPFDFDGDRRTDIAIFRPAGGEWWVNRSETNTTTAAQFGASSDKLVPADYTGDGKTDFGLFRPSTGQWLILSSENSTFYGFQFGASTDIPAPGDFDGDRKADPTVYRPSQGAWYTLRSNDGGVTSQAFGIAEDLPVVADYDGDGKVDIAIFRPSTGAWWLSRSTAGTIAVRFGQAGDKTVQSDYTGDGKADIAFFRPSNGQWYILRSEDYSFYGFPFGGSSDLPIPGDYDGDGRIDASVFRPSNNGWYLMRSTAGTTSLQFGLSGDYPIPNVYVR